MKDDILHKEEKDTNAIATTCNRTLEDYVWLEIIFCLYEVSHWKMLF